MARRKTRPGYFAMPRWLFQEGDLSTDERWLLAYFASFAPSWEHRVDDVLRNTGWGRQKYHKVRQALVATGRLTTEPVRTFDKKLGKKVVTGFYASANTALLNDENHHSEGSPECRLSAPSKSSPIRRASFKGRPASGVDLVDDDDPLLQPPGKSSGRGAT